MSRPTVVVRAAPPIQPLVDPAVDSGPRWSPVLPSCASAELLALYCVSKLARCAVLRYAAEAEILTPDALAAAVDPDLCASALDRGAWAWGAIMIAGSFTGLVQPEDTPPPLLRVPVEGVLRLYQGDSTAPANELASTFILRVVEPDETPQEKVLRIYRTLGDCDPVVLPAVQDMLSLGLGRKSFASQSAVTVGSGQSTLPSLLLHILNDLLPVLPLREDALLGPVIARMRRFSTTADPPPARLKRRGRVGEDLFAGKLVRSTATPTANGAPKLRAGRRAGGRQVLNKRSSRFTARKTLMMTGLDREQAGRHISTPGSSRPLVSASSMRSMITPGSAGLSISPWASEIAALPRSESAGPAAAKRAVSPKPVAHNYRELETLETWFTAYQNSSAQNRRTRRIHDDQKIGFKAGVRHTAFSHQFLITSGIIDDDDSDA